MGKCHISLEPKTTEEVSQLLLAGIGCQALQVLQRGIIQLQKLYLMLGKVTDIEPGIGFVQAAHGRELLRKQLNQGGFTGTVAPQQTDAGAGYQIEMHLVENSLVAVADRHIFHLHQGVGQRIRLAKFHIERAVGLGRHQLSHPFQCLQAALGLFGFTGLVTEAVHKRLHVRPLSLLALIGHLLLGHTLGASVFKGAVVTLVEVEFQVFHMDDFVHYGIDKVTVVADQHQCTLIGFNPTLQPVHGIQIQVVGGFIEQQ